MDETEESDSQANSRNRTESDLSNIVHSLSAVIENITFNGKQIEAGGQTFERTVIQIHRDGYTGFGEDVTPTIKAHKRLRQDGISIPTGRQTIESVTTFLDTESFPSEQTAQNVNRNYLRWGIESAILDLALKQAGETLATVLERSYDPVRFVASPQLGDPPSLEPMSSLQETVPNLEFKIDVPDNPTDELLGKLSATNSVRVLDLKEQYESETDSAPDPELYRRLFKMFPNAIIEDPAVTNTTREVLENHIERISWDAPITSVESLQERPWDPEVINVKPCRFGTLESLFRVLEYAFENDIDLYGGGMFELGAGRAHLQAIASLFYPDSPNDIAPSEYHWFDTGQSLPSSPLIPPANSVGIGWHSG